MNLTVLANEACQSDYIYTQSDITPQMLCAAAGDGMGGQDSCQGDSGQLGKSKLIWHKSESLGGALVSSSGGDGVTPGQNYQQIGTNYEIIMIEYNKCKSYE